MKKIWNMMVGLAVGTVVASGMMLCGLMLGVLNLLGMVCDVVVAIVSNDQDIVGSDWTVGFLIKLFTLWKQRGTYVTSAFAYGIEKINKYCGGTDHE